MFSVENGATDHFAAEWWKWLHEICEIAAKINECVQWAGHRRNHSTFFSNSVKTPSVHGQAGILFSFLLGLAVAFQVGERRQAMATHRYVDIRLAWCSECGVRDLFVSLCEGPFWFSRPYHTGCLLDLESSLLRMHSELADPMIVPSAKTCIWSSKWGIPRTGYLVPGRDTPRAQPNGLRAAGTPPPQSRRWPTIRKCTLFPKWACLKIPEILVFRKQKPLREQPNIG